MFSDLCLYLHLKSGSPREKQWEKCVSAHEFPSFVVCRIQLSWQALGKLCTPLGLACFQHSPVVFCPPQRQLQLTAHCPLTPPAFLASSLARLSGPRRSPVTGQGAKSLLAKHS